VIESVLKSTAPSPLLSRSILLRLPACLQGGEIARRFETPIRLCGSCSDASCAGLGKRTFEVTARGIASIVARDLDSHEKKQLHRCEISPGQTVSIGRRPYPTACRVRWVQFLSVCLQALRRPAGGVTPRGGDHRTATTRPGWIRAPRDARPAKDG
jgi:hypothetical protein